MYVCTYVSGQRVLLKEPGQDEPSQTISSTATVCAYMLLLDGLQWFGRCWKDFTV